MIKQKDSPAMQLLRLTWCNCNSAVGHSWERLNHAMAAALRLAIGSGFAFDSGDFARIESEFNFYRWGGADGGFAASFYSLAVAVNNMSACLAFEAWKERPPIIADEVSYHSYGCSYIHGCGGSRQKGRLCVGCTFEWQGEQVSVSSMAATHAVACSHVENNGEKRLLHRYKITPALIIADRAERKEREKLLARATKLSEKIDAAEVCRRIGIIKDGGDSTQQFKRLPIAKIRKAIEKMEKEVSAT